MWTLLVWLNEKVISAYRSLKNRHTERKSKKLHVQQMILSRKLPEYLRRDMGLPPYSSRHEIEKKQP